MPGININNPGTYINESSCKEPISSDGPIPMDNLSSFLRERILSGTQWAVFEPNGEALWQKITNQVSDFLTRLWRNGVFAGETPDKAFYVKCDRTIMSEPDLEAGNLILEITYAEKASAVLRTIRFNITTDGNPNS